MQACCTAQNTNKATAKETPQKEEATKTSTNIHKITFGEIKKEGKLWGLDLSHYQEVHDWDKVKEQKPDFIFLKATEGVTIRDEKYAEYYNSIRKIEIPVGSYHFFSYRSTGKDQAKNFITTVKYKRGDLPLVLDAEFSRKMPAAKIVVKELLAFLKAMNTKYGSYPIIYCNYKYYLTYLKDHLPAKCKLWIVDYQGKPDCEWTFWQTTDKFNVGGIKGKVDFNLYSGTPEDFKKLLR